MMIELVSDTVPSIIGSVVIAMGGYIIKQIKSFRREWRDGQEWKSKQTADMAELTRKNTEAFNLAKQAFDISNGLKSRIEKIEPVYFNRKKNHYEH